MNSVPAARAATLSAAPAQSLGAEAQALALAQACHALWAATLSLMTAFMQTGAPAHRYLLARRIARNFGTLQGESCFSRETRDSFTRLARKWEDKAQRLSPHEDQRRGGWGMRLPAFLRR